MRTEAISEANIPRWRLFSSGEPGESEILLDGGSRPSGAVSRSRTTFIFVNERSSNATNYSSQSPCDTYVAVGNIPACFRAS